MYKILKQLQSETKKISVLLVIDLWVSGYITYVDKEVMCFEAEKRKGVLDCTLSEVTRDKKGASRYTAVRSNARLLYKDLKPHRPLQTYVDFQL